MKKLLFLLCLLCFVPTAVSAKECDDIQVYIKGRPIEILESFSGIEIKNNRICLPVRSVAESLGYDVQYVDKEKAVVLKKGDKQLRMVIGKPFYNVDGIKKRMDVSPYLSKDRTYLPMRLVAESFGEKVVWDGKNRVALFSEMPINREVKGKTIQLADGISFVIPDALKQRVLFKEGFNEQTHKKDKMLYEKKNYEKMGDGWLGTFSIDEKPESEVISFVIRRLDKGYLVFSCPSDVRYDSENKELTAAYKEAYKQLEEILSTVQVKDEKVAALN